MYKKKNCNQLICFLYGQSFASAERNYVAPRLVEIIFRHVFKLRPEGRVKTLQIITDNSDLPSVIAKNQRRLNKVKNKYGITVFVSALGSSIIQYLSSIFFEDNQDTVHVNSFSTVASLASVRNLIHVIPQDITSCDIFSEWTHIRQRSLQAFIVSDSGLWSSETASCVSESFLRLAPEAELVNVNIELSQLTDQQIVEESQRLVSMIATGPQPVMLVYLIDSSNNSQFFSALASDPRVPTSLNILFGNAGLSGITQPILDFLRSRNAHIIQPFKGGDEGLREDLQRKLDRSLARDPIDNPTGSSVVSTLITYTVTALDFGYYLAQLPANIRLSRRRYLSLVFDDNFDLLNGIYEIDEFTSLNEGEEVIAIGFVTETQLFIGDDINISGEKCLIDG